MLSIIICSVNPLKLERVKQNIAETAGVEHEIISIDNSENKYSICQAYNEGGREAVFPYLCFMHEDIQFATMGWGQVICHHLDNTGVGLLGIAGGDTKSHVPSSWSISSVSNEINLVQHYKKAGQEHEHILKTNPAIQGNKKKVVALDGVWLCTKKNIFDEFKFDEATFTGFHGYDIDYSLHVNTRYDIYVVFDILIHHFSEGSPDRQWIESAFLISKKWQKALPVSVYSLSPKDFKIHYWQSLQVLITHLLRLKYTNFFIFKTFIRFSFSRFFNTRIFLWTLKWLISKMYPTR